MAEYTGQAPALGQHLYPPSLAPDSRRRGCTSLVSWAAIITGGLAEGVTGSTGAGSGRYYRKGHEVTHREDLTHEYKGHRCISVYDLPSHVTSSGLSADFRKTKSAVSASVCGMLNTGVGGTVYLGVDDGGRVVGLRLTSQQQQHVLASLSWTLSRFTPAVHPDRYCVNFVLVLAPSSPAPPRHATPPLRPVEGADTLHHVATPRPCWCDKEARRQATAPPEWVVEIHLRPWNLSSETLKPSLAPLHLSEANVCYYRHGSRQITLSEDDIRRLLVTRTERYYTRTLVETTAHLEELRARVKELRLRGKEQGTKRHGCGGGKKREDVEGRGEEEIKENKCGEIREHLEGIKDG